METSPSELDIDNPKKEKPWRDKELLEKAYQEADLTQTEIANLWETTQTTISTWIDKHNIKSRDPVEAQQHYSGKKPWHDEEILRDVASRHDEATAMARELEKDYGEKVSGTTLRKWLNRYDLWNNPRKQEKPWQKEGVLKGFLEEDYSGTEIAEELGCDQSTISRWLKHFDLTP